MQEMANECGTLFLILLENTYEGLKGAKIVTRNGYISKSVEVKEFL